MAKDPYLVAIDIGSNSIKLAVAKDSLHENEKVQILALVERPSSGIKRGIVTNMNEATESLIDTINQAESIIGLPIKKAVIGINGTSITFTNSDGLVVISRPDNEILENDVERVIQDSLAKAFGINNNEILHVIPRNFTVDNQKGIRFPTGMVGSKLEAKTLVVSCEPSYIRNFTKVFNQASVDIVDRIFTPLASGDFLLTTRQKKAGTILIDLGYASTSFIIWENEEILGSGVIPIGSDHVTADMAVGLQTNMEMAEEIKKQHLDLGNIEDDEISEVEMYNPDLQINESFKIDEIRNYAKPRVEEIFMYINKELRKLGKNSLPGGAVLIGGGASLKNIDEVAKNVLRQPIFRYVFDKNSVEFVPDYNNDPIFINAIAIAAYSLFHAEEITYTQKITRNPGNRSNSSQASGLESVFKSIWPWS